MQLPERPVGKESIQLGDEFLMCYVCMYVE